MTTDASAIGVVARRVNRRAVFVRWMRRTHGWFGLWGALLGLIFGLSGVWLNHRAVLKLDLPAQKISNAQVQLPAPAPESVDMLAAWLADRLKMDPTPKNVRIERARPVPWGDRKEAEEGGTGPLTQPERWSFALGGPDHLVQVEYWRGNRSISVRTVSNGFIATLTNLHKGVAMPIPWILLVDTMAGSLIFLSVSGLILWWETNRRRQLGIAIFGVSVVVTVGLAMWPLQA
ncbi:MAG: PepSY-associated TM helix domain-containing protein [Proteobacteria bacterium]|nr:PepSY-associated TM helix domain-containing protein [Pseudomonadota bacterium]